MESKCCLTQCLSGKIILSLVQFRIEFLLLFQNLKILQFANFLNKEKNDKFASLKKPLKLDVAAVLGTKVCRNHFMFKQHFILQRQFGVLTRPELIWLPLFLHWGHSELGTKKSGVDVVAADEDVVVVVVAVVVPHEDVVVVAAALVLVLLLDLILLLWILLLPLLLLLTFKLLLMLL